MFPVQTKITRKGSGDVTDTFCPPSGVLHSASRLPRPSAHPEQALLSPPVVRIGWGGWPVIADAEAMYSFAHDLSGGSSTAWGQVLACREIGEALSTLEEAGATLVSLIDASDWRSAGLRALNELLARVRDDTAVEIGNLEVRRWELAEGSVG